MDAFAGGMQLFQNSISAIWSFWNIVWNRVGPFGASLYLSAIFTILVFRFFLFPLVGGSGSSDHARKSGKKAK